MEGKFLGAPVHKADKTVPGEGAVIMEELEFVLNEGGEAVLAGQSAGRWATGEGFCGGRSGRE